MVDEVDGVYWVDEVDFSNRENGEVRGPTCSSGGEAGLLVLGDDGEVGVGPFEFEHPLGG